MSDSVALTHLDPSFNSANPTYSGAKPEFIATLGTCRTPRCDAATPTQGLCGGCVSFTRWPCETLASQCYLWCGHLGSAIRPVGTVSPWR